MELNTKQLAAHFIIQWMINNPTKAFRVTFKPESPYCISDDKDSREAYLEFFTYIYGREVGIAKYKKLYDTIDKLEPKYPLFVINTIESSNHNHSHRFCFCLSRVDVKDVVITHNYIQLGDLFIELTNPVTI